ncbi:hypothetical protein B0H14DRAFT_3536775 [Mycena olivaceomarginata]|nr:hypothetical protein B0H14DRAFT_3536775 [Mycena olivaceomarginata]
MPLAAADRISEGPCLAPTCLGRAHRSPQRNDVVPRELGGLGTGGDAIHPCRVRNLRLYGARARLLGVALTGCRLRREMRHSGLGLGGPSESGNGNKATAECTTARTFGKSPPTSPYPLHCAAISGSTAPRPFINDTVRTRRGFINGRYEPLTTGARVPPVLSPNYVASIRLSTILSPSSCRFPRLHPRASAPTTPLPPYNDASPAAPSASPPAHSFLAPASYNRGSKRAQNMHAAYNELVASATPTTSRPHPPPRIQAPSWAITILRPKPSPRAEPSHFYGHPILRGDCFLHPRT